MVGLRQRSWHVLLKPVCPISAQIMSARLPNWRIQAEQHFHETPHRPGHAFLECTILSTILSVMVEALQINTTLLEISGNYSATASQSLERKCV